MKNAWKTLKALLASDDDDESLDLDTTAKGAAKKTPEKDDSDDDEKSDDDDDQEKKKDDKKKKSDTSDSDQEDKKAETDDTKEASSVGSVHLALDDYNGLIALASKAKSALAENKALKAKADQWDAYQAAVSGNKPDADTAGAKAAKEQEGSKDPNADLRTKYGSLMADC